MSKPLTLSVTSQVALPGTNRNQGQILLYVVLVFPPTILIDRANPNVCLPEQWHSMLARRYDYAKLRLKQY